VKIVLYSTGCPKCSILKKKLEAKGIEYIENNQVDEMVELGISHVLVLSVDGELMSFADANRWINECKG